MKLKKTATEIFSLLHEVMEKASCVFEWHKMFPKERKDVESEDSCENRLSFRQQNDSRGNEYEKKK